MNKEKLQEATMIALRENEIKHNLSAYKEVLSKLLDLTMPRTKLSYSYTIDDEEITLYCTDGDNSRDDMQAINSVEGWCTRFAKQIPNYDKVFSDDRGWDWYSGCTFGSSGYRSTDEFIFDISVQNIEELESALSSFKSDDLDKKIKDKENKYASDVKNKFVDLLNNLGFTDEQIKVLQDLKMDRFIGQFRKLTKNNQYKNIPVELLVTSLEKMSGEPYCMSIPERFGYILSGLRYVDGDMLNKLWKKFSVYDVVEKAKEISDKNIQNILDKKQPELVSWAKQTMKNAEFDHSFFSPYYLVRAVNNGYSKETVEDVLTYYKGTSGYNGYKANCIKGDLLDILVGSYDLDKSQVSYILNLAKDYRNIKYPQTLPEIIKALQSGLSTENINDVLSKYSSTKDIRAAFKQLLKNK